MASLRPTLAVFLWLAPTRAAAAPPPAEVQALLVLRALSYDRALADRVPDRIVVGVAYRIGNTASESRARDFASAVDIVAQRMQVVGHPVSTDVRAVAPGKVEEAFGDAELAVLYVAPAMESDWPSIREYAGRQRILSVAANDGFVPGSAGLQLSTRDSRPVLLVDLPETTFEGVQFGADFLAVADVRR